VGDVDIPNANEGDGDEVLQVSLHADSSDCDWLLDYEDEIESAESDFDVDILDEAAEFDKGILEGCMRLEAFTPMPM